jgi:hypothetical protein
MRYLNLCSGAGHDLTNDYTVGNGPKRAIFIIKTLEICGRRA